MLTLAPDPYAAALRAAVTGDWKEAAMPKTNREDTYPTLAADAVDVSLRLLSTDEVARWLVVPVSTLYTWRYKGTGPKAFRVGKHLRYRLADVLTWLEQHADDSDV